MPPNSGPPSSRPLPTGTCWCGCGEATPVGSFFAQGHDKRAESAVILTQFGGVPQFLLAFGFGPGGRSARAELDHWRAKGGQPR